MKKLLVTVMAMLLYGYQATAQCAMCRATLENNVSNGHPGIAAGINVGIMYLFFAPYLAVGVLAYMWLRTSRKNANSNIRKRPVAG